MVANMLIKIKYLMFFGLFFVSTWAFAGLWIPSSNADVSSITFAGSRLNNVEIGIFKATQDGSLDKLSPIATFTGNATVTFVHNGGNWDVSVAGQTASLSGSNEFQLGWLINGVWVTDIDVAPNPETPNLWELTFLNPDDTANVEKLSVANAEPVAQNILLTHNISTASLATTAWGFLGGLLGCLAVSKRRSEHLID